MIAYQYDNDDDDDDDDVITTLLLGWLIMSVVDSKYTESSCLDSRWLFLIVDSIIIIRIEYLSSHGIA